jgi:hypothetical protein
MALIDQISMHEEIELLKVIAEQPPMDRARLLKIQAAYEDNDNHYIVTEYF